MGDLPGLGTALNVLAVLVGSGVGLLLGARLPTRVRSVVTDALGLVTLLVGGLSAATVTSPTLTDAVGSGAVLVVLGSLLLGGILGAALRLEDRLAGLGGRLERRLARRRGPAAGAPAEGTFVRGFVTASLVFCVGPLTVLGALSDGLGRGIEELVLKSTLDGFASVAFAAAYGPGVAASALTVLVVQGAFTVLGATLGSVVPLAGLDALTATGGLLLVGVGLRLLDVKQVPVADLLPSLAVAPVLVALVGAVNGP